MVEHKKYYRRSDKQIIEALQKTHGIIYDAAKLLGYSGPSSLQKRIRENKPLKDACDEAREYEVDWLHSKMVDLAEKGEYRAIEFLLRKLGRNQGFGDVQEINIRSSNVNQNFDASKLSEEEQEKLYEFISKATPQN